MATTLLFLGIIALGFMLYLTRADIRFLHRRIEELEARLAPEPARPADEAPPVAAKARRSAVVSTTPIVAPAPAPAPPPKPTITLPRKSPLADLNFENLIGGKLPIWIGGVALVFAGFFLVRYTIEAGLFGPGARAITAALFAFAMIAMSELGGRLPKIGDSFTADPRVGQSLAGAGVATLYGTLYMSAEIYGLIGVATAFLLVVITTLIAFALALRHGPPTALMGLIGGFAAPWVAGMGSSNLPTLLLYLAVFIAALFGLAVWRRWLWLLVLASGGGLAWSLAMLVTANSSFALLGGFIATTGGGALLAAKRFDDAKDVWTPLARYAPMALALIQLALLLPKTEFSPIAWMFYFALCALTIIVAWRERALLPLVGGALLIAMGPLALAWSKHGQDPANILITFGIASLFGIAGHVRARSSERDTIYWAIVGLIAPAMCWFVAAFSHVFFNDSIWAALALLAALPAMWTSWQWHIDKRTTGVQSWATGTAALMVWMAAILLIDMDWIASYTAVVALGVAAWAKFTGGKWEQRLVWAPLGMAMVLTSAFSWQFFNAVGQSLSGVGAYFDQLPSVGDAARATLLPALLIAAATWPPLFATGRRARALAFIVGGAGITAFVWLIAKQVAAIVSPSDFIRFGFAERAAITQALFVLGWLALTEHRKRPEWPSLRSTGWALSAIALFRFIWFDLLIHNPVIDPQAVGPVPIANLLSIHCVLTAGWLWILASGVPQRFALSIRGLSLGAVILATLATVRQAVQGNLVTGAGVETSENYLYSAALLSLAIAWLIWGITRQTKLLRVAGLSLLTVVTLKVFLVDAAALTGLLRILSFLGLGIALIGIGWAYGRVMGLNPQKH